MRFVTAPAAYTELTVQQRFGGRRVVPQARARWFHPGAPDCPLAGRTSPVCLECRLKWQSRNARIIRATMLCPEWLPSATSGCRRFVAG